ncbi:MAG: two-component sensor histidine kinase [Winogradskyella sp.]|nr:two-component sensor histidine kinase [Winogradskyella sp.]|tara:strand:- start:579 stop:1952 length:1374 start_codon:yes stop_codon:yes gene_type:complete
MLKKLWLSYRQWYVKYLGLQNHKNETDRLSYYRDQLFISIFTLTMVLGSISYFPSIIAAIILDKWFVFYADTIAILVLFFGFLHKNLSLENRKVIYSATFLVLSFGLVYDLGLGGNGTILLFMLSILITLYSSTRSGINSIIITAVFYLTLILIKYFNIINIQFFVEGPLEGLIIVFINNIIFCLLTVYAVSFLIQQLHKAFIKENELQQMLKKEHDKTIKAKNEAEQSNKLKTAFLSNMSHEIKTPLYGITGSAQLLKSDLQLDKANNEYFQIIENNSKLLLAVFNDVLEISQLETGNVPIDISKVKISDLLDKIKSEFTGKVQEKDIQFSTTINFKTNKTFRTDQDKLHKALNHIIDNAIKFSPKNAIVNISCSPVAEETLQFKISDNGIGISDIHIDKVHLPFFTIDLENKTGAHGAGLGLSIAKSYIELLGGTLQIESEVNKGTTVIFQLNNL